MPSTPPDINTTHQATVGQAPYAGADEARALRVIVRLALATTLIVTAFALANPVLAVLLGQRGYDTVTVGAFAMIPFALVAVLIPVMPRVLTRIGLVPAYRAGCALELLGGLGYALGDSLLAWSLSSVVSGAGAAALWNATEALLARHAPAQRRGRVMGLYQTCLGAALAVGPFVPGLLAPLGLQARGALWLAALVIAASVLMAWTVPQDDHPRQPGAASEPGHGVWAAMRAVPALVWIALAGGVFESGLGSVSAAHMAAQGLSLAGAASVVGAIGVGSFMAQYPAGWLADHLRPGTVFGAAAAVLMLASAATAFSALGEPWAWLLWAGAAVWGGVGGALYTLTMIRVAHQFGAASVAAGTAAMITGYTAGGIAGPLVSGALLQWAGLPGMACWLVALAASVGVAATRLR